MTLFDESGQPLVCFECDEPADHMHHVIPRSRGGSRMVPLCVGCHGRVHDVNGWRTDTLRQLRRGASRPVVLTAGEAAERKRRHRRVLGAFREMPGSLKRPPALVKTRRMGDLRYEEWLPWLEHTLQEEARMKALADNRPPLPEVKRQRRAA